MSVDAWLLVLNDHLRLYEATETTIMILILLQLFSFSQACTIYGEITVDFMTFNNISGIYFCRITLIAFEVDKFQKFFSSSWNECHRRFTNDDTRPYRVWL